MPPEKLKQRLDEPSALEFSHSLNDQIGGQIDAGFVIAGFYEDGWTDEASRLNPHMPIFIATLAIKTWTLWIDLTLALLARPAQAQYFFLSRTTRPD